MKTTNWTVSGSSYFPSNISNKQAALENKVYELNASLSGLYLVKTKDKYEFPYKVYGHELSFIKRVGTAYKSDNRNLSVLLTGIQGTGKSVTAMQICNELNLPVIVVTTHYNGFVDFINSLQEDVIIFVDEFEKTFKDNDADILSLMDGALNNQYRKVFVLTTNSMKINEYLLQRPSRIRYIKKYGNLAIDVIEEIVDDLLIYKEKREDVIKFVAQLTLITIDIVKSVINEVNIFNESPEEFKDLFNVKKLVPQFNIEEYECDEHGEIIKFKRDIKYAVIGNPYPFVKSSVGNMLNIGGYNKGTIKKYLGNKVMTQASEYNEDLDIYKDVNRLYIVEETEHYNEHFVNNYNHI